MRSGRRRFRVHQYVALLSIFAAPVASQSAYLPPPPAVLMGAYDPYGTFANDPRISIEHIYIPWQDVDLASLNAADKYAHDRGRRLLITVEPWTWSRSGDPETPQAFYAGIMGGRDDQLIRALCQKMASLASEVTIRWGHEMDLANDRYPWSAMPGAEYAQAFRHFVDGCRAAGGKLQFMWSPRGEPRLREYYPGDDYVDSIGITVFGFQEYELGLYGRPLSLPERLAPTYQLVEGYGKDLYISEFGCHGDATYLQSCLEQARSVASRFPKIRGVIYFNEVETYPWPGAHGSPDWRIMSRLFSELPR